jgi:hypothetical protein
VKGAATKLVSILCLAVAMIACGCGGDSDDAGTGPGRTSRSAALGFTYTPYDNTDEAVLYAFDVIRRDGDLLVSHHDDGIPWDAALANDYDAYPADLRGEIDAVQALRPAGHELYLAVTPIAFLRDRLAPVRLDGGVQSFQAPWASRAFDDPDVIAAYTNHCRIMIDRLHPDWFAFGIEVNILRASAGEAAYGQYATLAAAVYAALKESYPGLPMFQTVQAEFFHADRGVQESAIRQILPCSDIIAVSSYPFSDAARYPDGSTADPSLLPADYFSALAGLDASKPFAIAETGWPAEDVTAPYPLTIRSTAELQKRYVELLLERTEACAGVFVNWFVARDYDALWDKVLKTGPNANLVRLWRDNGLYDGEGNARPALDVWRAQLALPRRQP